MSRYLCFLFVLWLAAPAAAQVRAGVPLESALPGGVTALDVRAPDTERGAVRVRLTEDGRAPVAILDVWVRPSEAEARALYAERSPMLASRALVARPGLGEEASADVASGAAGLVLLRRDNVVLALRAIDPQLDAAELAGALDAAIAAGASGPTAAGAAPQVQRTAGGVVITAGPDVLDLTVVPEDGALAHRTETGWRASGRGTVRWVDAQLRVGTLTF